MLPVTKWDRAVQASSSSQLNKLQLPKPMLVALGDRIQMTSENWLDVLPGLCLHFADRSTVQSAHLYSARVHYHKAALICCQQPGSNNSHSLKVQLHSHNMSATWGVDSWSGKRNCTRQALSRVVIRHLSTPLSACQVSEFSPVPMIVRNWHSFVRSAQCNATFQFCAGWRRRQTAAADAIDTQVRRANSSRSSQTVYRTRKGVRLDGAVDSYFFLSCPGIRTLGPWSEELTQPSRVPSAGCPGDEARKRRVVEEQQRKREIQSSWKLPSWNTLECLPCGTKKGFGRGKHIVTQSVRIHDDDGGYEMQKGIHTRSFRLLLLDWMPESRMWILFDALSSLAALYVYTCVDVGRD